MEKNSIFADFHFHSKYSRAVSSSMNLHGLALGALKKGLGIIGTGDFSHPLWLKEIENNLIESEFEGLYRLKEGNGPLYTLTNEVATIISTERGVKKVHHVIHCPDFQTIKQLNDVYSKMGKLSADGRPIFGKMSSSEFVERTMEVSKDILIYPAHVWTPWFGALGSKGGYDSLEECYEDQVKHIHAIETGISSDPKMNWRLSKLDKFAKISNSDAHSNHPWRLGRECNAFLKSDKLSYSFIVDAIISRNSDEFLYTIETNPAYGKYHYDGHRKCDFSCNPQESLKLNRICPKCNKPLVIGVENRVEELADRPIDYVPNNAIGFKTILPLHELIASMYKKAIESKIVQEKANNIVDRFNSELEVLLNVPEHKLTEITDKAIVDAIMKNREGKIDVVAGYDGVYGKVII